MHHSIVRLSFTTLALIVTMGLAISTVYADTPAQSVYQFDILRNGTPVGRHELQVTRGGDEVRVLAKSNINVTLLGFNLYQMRYRAEEIWDGQGLKTLAVKVDDDGEVARIDGQRRGDRFHWATPDGEERSEPLPIYPSNHWNPDVLRASAVLNTLTGKSNRVNVAADGNAFPLPLPQPPQGRTTAYRYQGELNLHSWYDDSGRWLGMRFKGRDGSDIEYVCRNCAESIAL